MIYTYRKLIFSITAAMLVIGGGLSIYSCLRQPVKKPVSSQVVQPNTVQGLSNKSIGFSEASKKAITQYVDRTLIYKYSKSYPSTIRNGSYKRVVTPDGGIMSTILIDVPQTKETYEYTQTGSENSLYGESFLRCAPEAQQIVHPSVCKEVAND